MAKSPPKVVRVAYARLHDGFFKLDLYTLDVPKHDGAVMRINRFVLERGDSVAILAYDPARDEVLLANEFVIGAYAANDNPFCTSLPAGSLWQGRRRAGLRTT